MNALAPILTPTELLHALRVQTQPNEARPALRDDELRSRAVRTPRWPLVALAAAAGVAASLVLLPQVAPVESQDRAPALARLEAQVASGDQSSATMIALARERQRAGDTPEALELLQDVVGQDPRNVMGWQALADMLHELGRGDDALAALERAQRLSPTPDRERLIAARRAATPRTAAPSDTAANARTADVNLLRAEQLLASGAPKDALNLLDETARAQPAAVDLRLVALQMQAVLALPAPAKRGPLPPDAAAKRASAWLGSRSRTAPDEALPLSSMLARAGHHRQAARLLDPWLAQGNANLVAAWALSMRASGQGDAASARLARLGQAQAADEVLRQRVRLALDAGKIDTAFEALRSHGIDRAAPDVVASWVHAVTQDARRTKAHALQMRELWSRAAPRLQQHDMPLAALTAWAAGDANAAATLADAAQPHCVGKAECAIRLARVQHELGRGAEAALALRLVEGPVGEGRLNDYARLSVAHGMAAEALANLERHRGPVPDATFDAAWALVATAAGRQADVIRWLETARAENLSAEAARELFDTAVHAKAHALTVAAGQRLDPRRVRPADRVMLAQALMDSGRTADALSQWRLIRSATRNYDEAYVSALRVALSRGVGAEARQEFARSQRAALERVPAGDHVRREALVGPMLELGALTEALPAVEALALGAPERWLQPFEALARRLERDDRLVAVWRRLAANPAPNAEQRLHIADALTSSGHPAAAEPALRILAADANPADAIAQRLIALWGPTLTLDQIDWIEARILRAGGRGDSAAATDVAERRAGWMQLLNDRGAPARTAALFRRLQPRDTSGPVFDAYVDALRRTGQSAAVARALGGSGPSTP